MTDSLPSLDELTQNATASCSRRRSILRSTLRFATRLLGKAMLLVLIIVGSAAVVYFGKPWLEYRQEHLVSYQGTIHREIIEVGSFTQGRVKDLLVSEGQEVSEGDLLAVLDNSILHANVAKAEADVAMADSRSKAVSAAIQSEKRELESSLGIAESSVAVCASKLEKDRNRLTYHVSELGRAKRLLDKNVISRSQYDQTVSNYQQQRDLIVTREAELLVTNNEASLAKAKLQTNGKRAAELRVIESSRRVAVSELDVALRELQASNIHAPCDGFVLRTMIGPGGSIKVGTPLIALQQKQAMSVDAWVDESWLNKIALGSEVKVTLKADGDRNYTGRVTAIVGFSNVHQLASEQAPVQDRTAIWQENAKVKIRVTLDDLPTRRLPAGCTAIVGIQKQESAADQQRMAVTEQKATAPVGRFVKK